MLKNVPNSVGVSVFNLQDFKKIITVITLVITYDRMIKQTLVIPAPVEIQ